MVENIEEMRDIEESFSYDYNDKFIMEDNLDRRIYLNSEINESAVDVIVYQIMRCNRLDRDIDIEDREPIRLHINSPGGSVIDGFSLIDCIKLSKTPVYTINLGMCFSMALLVFMAGHKRFSFPHSEFLLHDGQSSDANNTAKVKDYLDFSINQIEKMTKDYVIAQSAISEDSFDNNYRREWYFLPKEGKDIGVVDYIVGQDCDMDEIL